jgi:hypothetical protein
MAMIQLWLDIADKQAHLKLEWLLREHGIEFFDPGVATSETFEELENRLCSSCHARGGEA